MPIVEADELVTNVFAIAAYSGKENIAAMVDISGC